jgi:hypothetical protein
MNADFAQAQQAVAVYRVVTNNRSGEVTEGMRLKRSVYPPVWILLPDASFKSPYFTKPAANSGVMVFAPRRGGGITGSA